MFGFLKKLTVKQSDTVDFSQLYYMHSAWIRGALHLEMVNQIDDPLPIATGVIPPPQPLLFRHFQGGAPRDMVGTTWALLQLVSQRAVDVLNENHFTGWTVYPAQVTGKRGDDIPGLYLFVVTGKSGPPDPSRRKKVMLPPPSPTGCSMPGWRGLFFDPSTWDGSDIFCLEGTKHTIVTQAVKDALEKAKVRNFAFTALSEFESLWR
ncbi:MAG TPA: hypothetical protein VNT75_03150 [Symbiobacteriaceae bacterium]|nr:hypothetical protein [Symbiobacteriaceae bacterium]